MIKSMTGYGKAEVEIPGRKLTIEIKTLNSKQFDLGLKLPGFFRNKEIEVRAMISQRLESGKIEVFSEPNVGSTFKIIFYGND